MPGDGATAASGIRRRAPSTKVVALSAHEDRTTVLRMLEAGAVAYMIKGGSVDAIVESIQGAAVGQGSLSVEVAGNVIDELVGQLGEQRRDHERQRRVAIRIRRAIDDEAGLSIALQPICSLESRKIVGAEALARFKPPPDRGPHGWFAEAAEVGLQHELELLAARKSLELLDQLPAGTFLAINGSSGCLASSSFRELLSDTDCSRIVVELTEYEQIEDYDALSAALASIRSAGVRLAVDDAGAGFASLRHILRLEPDFIKLDRTLISGIERDRTRQALAAGLISFGDKIDVTIIAEGVERLVELEALMALGVRYGQGYFFAPPAPPPLPEIRLEASTVS